MFGSLERAMEIAEAGNMAVGHMHSNGSASAQTQTGGIIGVSLCLF